MRRRTLGMTLIELLVALSVFFLVVMGMVSMELFSRNQLVTVQRKAKLQNELTILFSHLSKYSYRAIGSGNDPLNLVVATPAFAPYAALQFYVDQNGNGVRDASPPDRWIGYAWTGVLNQCQVLFYENAVNNNPIGAGDLSEVVATGISAFAVVINPVSGAPIMPSGALGNTINYVEVSATACWDCSSVLSAAVCNNGSGGSHDNPSVTMSTVLSLPMVSTN